MSRLVAVLVHFLPRSFERQLRSPAGREMLVSTAKAHISSVWSAKRNSA